MPRTKRRPSTKFVPHLHVNSILSMWKFLSRVRYPVILFYLHLKLLAFRLFSGPVSSSSSNHSFWLKIRPMVAQSQRARSFDAEQLGLSRFESFSPSLKTQMGKKFSFVFFLGQSRDNSARIKANSWRNVQ